MDGDTFLVGTSKITSVGSAYVHQQDRMTPRTYCTSKPSSLPGCTPATDSNGTPVASAAGGFRIHCGPVPGDSLWIFLYTHDGTTSQPMVSAFGSLCISGIETFRTATIASGGTKAACDGRYAFDWNTHASLAFFTDPASSQPGTPVDGQFWYRDPKAEGGANLSEAIGLVTCP